MSPWVVCGLLLSAGALAGQAAETIPGTDLEPAELVGGLPWTFEVAIETPSQPESNQEAAQVTRYRFKSTEPYSTTAAGNVYLRAELTAAEHQDSAAAAAALEELIAGANPDTGLSYAWDQLLLSGTFVYHLHAPCLFSEDNFQRMASRLEEAVRRSEAAAARVAACRCGGGCREVAPE